MFNASFYVLFFKFSMASKVYIENKSRFYHITIVIEYCLFIIFKTSFI